MDEFFENRYDNPQKRNINVTDGVRSRLSRVIWEKAVTSMEESGSTIVHSPTRSGIKRVLPNTYLWDEENNKIYSLISALDISYFPVWGILPEEAEFFTMIFEGLHKDTRKFILINEDHHLDYESDLIYRNRSDVYRIEL